MHHHPALHAEVTYTEIYTLSGISPTWVLFAGGLIVSAIVILLVIAWQRRLAVGQHIYNDGPKSHASKEGTPTMGGLAFLFASLGVLIFERRQSHDDIALSLLAIAAGCIGAIDDLLIVVKRRPLGLKARWKFLLLAIAGATFAWRYAFDPRWFGFAQPQHFFGSFFMLSPWLFFVLAVLAIVGAANAVNLTDGLDGLAAGAVLPVLLFLTVASFLSGPAEAVFGACLVFLWFNRHPAKVFMGDTGSLLLGALIAGLAIQSGWLLVLPLLGIVFVVEALSVMAQVISFKMTGKRIFKMSPLHHHFELSGWSERSVTFTFVTISWLAVLAVVIAMWYS